MLYILYLVCGIFFPRCDITVANFGQTPKGRWDLLRTLKREAQNITLSD